jgi:geranylgeranyl diphosphate synthase type II
MVASPRIENVLKAIFVGAAKGAPPLLDQATQYAVFPGGARIRPRLCLAVAEACGDDDPAVANAAAASIELLHCASLVHDDLPCFDDAALRRGKPSVHAAFGQPLAVLTGDALIILAFETLARGAASKPDRMGALLRTVGRSVNMSSGIIAGQAWECEPRVVLEDYQRAKTGSLFVAAAMAGAIAAGTPPERWQMFGDRLGEAYQVADDLHDAASSMEAMGKPAGQDEALDRPSAVRELGVPGAVQKLKQLVSEAVEAIPDAPGTETLRAIIKEETKRFIPRGLARVAA